MCGELVNANSTDRLPHHPTPPLSAPPVPTHCRTLRPPSVSGDLAPRWDWTATGMLTRRWLWVCRVARRCRALRGQVGASTWHVSMTGAWMEMGRVPLIKASEVHQIILEGRTRLHFNKNAVNEECWTWMQLPNHKKERNAPVGLVQISSSYLSPFFHFW